MNKATLKKKTDEVISETRNALQTVYDALNQGQRKKLLKDEKVAKLFEKYNVLINE